MKPEAIRILKQILFYTLKEAERISTIKDPAGQLILTMEESNARTARVLSYTHHQYDLSQSTIQQMREWDVDMNAINNVRRILFSHNSPHQECIDILSDIARIKSERINGSETANELTQKDLSNIQRQEQILKQASGEEIRQYITNTIFCTYKCITKITNKPHALNHLKYFQQSKQTLVEEQASIIHGDISLNTFIMLREDSRITQRFLRNVEYQAVDAKIPSDDPFFTKLRAFCINAHNPEFKQSDINYQMARKVIERYRARKMTALDVHNLCTALADKGAQNLMAAGHYNMEQMIKFYNRDPSKFHLLIDGNLLHYLQYKYRTRDIEKNLALDEETSKERIKNVQEGYMRNPDELEVLPGEEYYQMLQLIMDSRYLEERQISPPPSHHRS